MPYRNVPVLTPRVGLPVPELDPDCGGVVGLFGTFTAEQPNSNALAQMIRVAEHDDHLIDTFKRVAAGRVTP